jgi:hypothetical protein
MLSNLIRLDSSYLIETSSLIVNHYVVNSSSFFKKMDQMNNSLSLPSFCNLTNYGNDCEKSLITLKVKLNFIRRKLFHLKLTGQ